MKTSTSFWTWKPYQKMKSPFQNHIWFFCFVKCFEHFCLNQIKLLLLRIGQNVVSIIILWICVSIFLQRSKTAYHKDVCLSHRDDLHCNWIFNVSSVSMLNVLLLFCLLIRIFTFIWVISINSDKEYGFL